MLFISKQLYMGAHKKIEFNNDSPYSKEKLIEFHFQLSIRYKDETLYKQVAWFSLKWETNKENALCGNSHGLFFLLNLEKLEMNKPFNALTLLTCLLHHG